jgi:hypothetical protein
VASSRSRLFEILLIVGLFAAPARADDVAVAREDFEKGASLAKSAQWAEALAAFERSAKARPHAVTIYNIGACQRAMGQYAAARKSLQAALAQHAASNNTELASTLEAETRGWIAEIETSILATLDLTIKPSDASLAIDGRPLELSTGMWVAGTRAPGPGEKVPSEAFKVRVDPGTHVLTISHKGYADALVTKTVGPAAMLKATIELDKLPATLHITSNVNGAVVTVNELDVGVAPVDLSRPGGSYHVLVRKPGFVAYDANVTMRAGERLDLTTRLDEEKPALTSKWWFWTAASAVVVGAAVGTYFIVHRDPEPQRPPLNGGGLGWTVEL